MLVYLSRVIFFSFALVYANVGWANITLSEANIKARFIHQFIIFAEWPESSFKQGAEDYKVGIVGDNVLVGVYQNMKNTDIGKRKVIVTELKENASAQELSQYHVIFVGNKMHNKLKLISKNLIGLSVLMVTEMDDSDESPAIINLIKKENKLRFSIDEKKASEVGIKFRSQLLRLAIKNN